MTPYSPVDRMYLWWLAQPAQPKLVGELRLLRETQGVSLRYGPAWLATEFALSEDLPLVDTEFMPASREEAVGAVDDARPDRWGERVIRFIDRPPRLSLLEFLYFAGDDRFGALGVSTSADAYRPHNRGALATLADVDAISQLVARVIAGQPIDEAQKRLVAPGATMGGARPKALVNIDAVEWVVKFADEARDDIDEPLVEHACMTLAAHARIRVAQTRALPLANRRHAVAVRRFDRVADGATARRLHAQTAHVALRAEGSPMGYPELAQLLRRRGTMAGGEARHDMREVFRRMVFNILIDNTDDHEKNHALLFDDARRLRLAPAFDIVPTGQALGYQQLRVGRDGADSTIDNALSDHTQFGMSRDEAVAEASEVARICATWRQHFAATGVSGKDIESLARTIDRDYLLKQRTALLAPTP